VDIIGKFGVLSALSSMFFGLVCVAQTVKPVPVSKSHTPEMSSSTLAADAERYQKLLDDPDIGSDPDIRQELYGKLVEATCQGKRLKLQEILGNSSGDSVYSTCTKRLMAEGRAGSALKVQPTSTANTPPASVSAQCALVAALPTANATFTKYAYTLQCPPGVTPNALAISAPASSHPLVTDAQRIESAEGIAFQSYDAAKATVSFSFPGGASSHSFQVRALAGSADVVIATYVIASGSVTDLAKCQAVPLPAGCSTATVQLPVSLAVKCPSEPQDTNSDAPTLNFVDTGSKSVSGKLREPATGSVRVCRGGVPLGNPGKVKVDGTFDIDLSTLSDDQQLEQGQKIVAQFTSDRSISGLPSTTMS
jgi:hypothetical protein